MNHTFTINIALPRGISRHFRRKSAIKTSMIDVICDHIEASQDRELQTKIAKSSRIQSLTKELKKCVWNG